jgi:hypothetical protein
MELNNIIRELRSFTPDQLRDLNTAVCRELKAVRNTEAALKRHTLMAGDKVNWNGRNGYTEGTIVRVKRKKAICDIGSGRNWDVPLAMLNGPMA